MTQRSVSHHNICEIPSKPPLRAWVELQFALALVKVSEGLAVPPTAECIERFFAEGVREASSAKKPGAKKRNAQA